ncbi:MAG: 16S rRNA processing protein RimM [Clostridia bacterium]|nr:16S rRNA processing protein RimM [Clostridia bacterium]
MVIQLGDIIKAQGLSGEVKVKPLLRDASLFKSLKTMLIDGSPFKVSQVSIRQGFVYIRFESVSDRNRAEAIIGKKVGVDESLLPALNKGEFYIKDLIGKEVMLSSGELLGRLESIENYGSADIITVRGNKVVRFPFLKKLNLTLDNITGYVTIDENCFSENAVYED